MPVLILILLAPIFKITEFVIEIHLLFHFWTIANIFFTP